MIFDNDSLGWVRDRKTRRREAAGRKKTGQNSGGRVKINRVGQKKLAFRDEIHNAGQKRFFCPGFVSIFSFGNFLSVNKQHFKLDSGFIPLILLKRINQYLRNF